MKKLLGCDGFRVLRSLALGRAEPLTYSRGQRRAGLRGLEGIDEQDFLFVRHGNWEEEIDVRIGLRTASVLRRGSGAATIFLLCCNRFVSRSRLRCSARSYELFWSVTTDGKLSRPTPCSARPTADHGGGRRRRSARWCGRAAWKCVRTASCRQDQEVKLDVKVASGCAVAEVKDDGIRSGATCRARPAARARLRPGAVVLHCRQLPSHVPVPTRIMIGKNLGRTRLVPTVAWQADLRSAEVKAGKDTRAKVAVGAAGPRRNCAGDRKLRLSVLFDTPWYLMLRCVAMMVP